MSNFFLPPFSKAVYSKRKEIAPKGSKFFLFRVDPFQKELDVEGSMQSVTEFVCQKNGGKYTRYIECFSDCHFSVVVTSV